MTGAVPAALRSSRSGSAYVTAIGDEPAQASRDCREHLRSNSYIAGVARGEVDDRRPANDVGDDVDFGGLPASRDAEACAFAPLMDGPPLTPLIG